MSQPAGAFARHGDDLGSGTDRVAGTDRLESPLERHDAGVRA